MRETTESSERARKAARSAGWLADGREQVDERTSGRKKSHLQIGKRRGAKWLAGWIERTSQIEHLAAAAARVIYGPAATERPLRPD